MGRASETTFPGLRFRGGSVGRWVKVKHRERVLMALYHEEPDRCPMQISFTPEFASRLKDDLGLTDGDFHNPHGGGNTYMLERTLDEDMLLTSVGWANSYYATEVYSEDGVSYTDEWGVGWKNVEYETRFGKGRYTEIVGHPLADDDAIDSYQPPDPNRPELYVEAERVIKEYKDEYWIVGVTVTTVFETAWALRGYERTLMDLAVHPDFIEKLFDIPFNYHLTAAKKLVKMGVDMIWIGDDMGAQDRMLISPETWRRFFKPRMATFISALKSINPDVKVAYHSDGNISPIIPDLIEIDLDVLNPIQPQSMDPEKVKKEYGDKLCFWGSMDEQYTLPFGTPAEVEREVITRLKTLGKNGGLIIGPTHHVQLDTSLENFWAMVNAITKTLYSSL
jgi:uroporphyrinogen decarboxylase